jgi:hypothetical protein
MKCNDYFEYYKEDSPSNIEYYFGFYIYEFDWEKNSRYPDAKTCVLVRHKKTNQYSFMPVIGQKVLWETNSSIKEPLPQELVGIINRFVKNMVFL